MNGILGVKGRLTLKRGGGGKTPKEMKKNST